MKYQILNTFRNDINVVSINKLKARSYFIPYDNKQEAINVDVLDKRYKSKLVTCLNGMWDFKFYNNPNDLPINLDTDKISFDKIKVPGCIQYQGYSYPAYINVRYPFQYNPPLVPDKEAVVNDGTEKANRPDLFNKENEYNFICLYRTFINIESLDYRNIISFLGVCSNLELYVNGKFVGYSEGSHNTSEFDLNDFVNVGKNEIICLVSRWCNGSYLECQDMFRNNGIFRDVLLRKENKIDIYDISYITIKHDDLYDLKVEIETTGNIDVNVTVVNKTKKVKCVKGNNTIIFNNLKVKQWNAEEPNTYDLVIETNHSSIVEKIGFKDVKVIGDIYYLNGKNIKIKGGNHHDTSPINGFSMSPSEILKDVLNVKDFNMNAIRTSHYPPDPLLLELATIYGIYIISEADIETHGCTYAIEPLGDMNKIARNPIFKQAFKDRAISHYNRDKLIATPIIMYSLGNEAGDGINFTNNYKYYKSVTDIPIQYEGATHSKHKAYDIASEMYPSVNSIIKVGKKTHKIKRYLDRPYFLCEYAHAMGVGPGDIDSYVDAFYKYDNLLGGCIWELNDHGVLEKDGHYSYGGDHNEWIHDGNFCCDGLFYPDRTPSTGAYLAKHAYRPIRIRKVENNKFEVFNTTAFTSGTNYEITIDFNGKNKKKYVFDVKPFTKKVFELDVFDDNSNLLLMNIKTYDKKAKKVVDVSQIVLRNKVKEIYKKCNLPKEFKEENGNVSLTYKGNTLEASNPYSILYRVSTDNDRHNWSIRIMEPFYKQETKIVSVKKAGKKCVIESEINVNDNIFKVIDSYEGISNGVVVTSTLLPIKAEGFLPRFGKAYKLDSSFDTINYIGKDKESYIDMCDYAIIGNYTKKVVDMTENNIMPQESGNRMNSRYVKVSNGNNGFIFKAVDKDFNLGVKPYSDVELSMMKHTTDEKVSGTYITLSAFQMGIGTGSCGPETLNKYRYKANKKYSIKYIISYK